MAQLEQSPDYGVLQEFIDSLYRSDPDAAFKRLDIIIEAESFGLNADLQEIISLLPPSSLYTRDKLCGQLNSALSSHGWGYYYGCVH